MASPWSHDEFLKLYTDEFWYEYSGVWSSTEYIDAKQKNKEEHSSLSAYAILFLDLDDASSESSQMSGGKEQDMNVLKA